jgi:hypothetical protein
MTIPQTALYLVLECGSGSPVTLARVADRRFLVEAARHAISESQNRVGEMRAEDALLGELQNEESVRLGRALALAIPELQTAARCQ